jgi:hypothetical protein
MVNVPAVQERAMFPAILRQPWPLIGVILVVGLTPSLARPQIPYDGVAKQVDLVIDGDWLAASNIRYSRFDEFKLNARERVRDSAVGKAVIVIATNQRLIAYGVGSGWRTLPRVANEQIESVSAEDFAGLIITNERLLNFNGESGVWGEQKRPIRR